MSGSLPASENNNSLGASEEALAAQAAALRRETEATIALLSAVHANAVTHHASAKQLQSKLSSEEQKASEALAKCDAAQKEAALLQEQASTFEATVSELRSTIASADDVLSSTVAAKESRITQLEADVVAQEELMVGLKHLRGNVDSFRVGVGLLKEPCGALMLSDGCVVVADTMVGLLKFSPNTELLRQVQSPDWKWPQGLAFDARRNVLVVTMAQRVDSEGEKFERVIAEFSPALDLLKTSPGPKQAALDHASKERLALGRAGELFLALADNVGSSLYKYAAGEWYMLTGRPGAYFADVSVLAQTGPITELLVVETKMGYIHKLAIRGFDVADRRSIAAVERPGAIAVDEEGRLFCQDTISGKIREIDTVRWEAKRDVCVMDEALFAISAASGYLGAAGRESASVRIFRYSDKAAVLGDLVES